MLDAMSIVENKSELLWFYRIGSPIGTDCGNLTLVLGCSTGGRVLVLSTLFLPPRCQAEWARGWLPMKEERWE